MSFNVAMLEAMQAEGLDLDACIRVLKAGERRPDPTAAERMRNMRARKKAAPVTQRNVTRTPPNDIDILTPEVSEPIGSSPQPWACPVGVDPQIWSDFLTNRKRKRFPNTPSAWKGFTDDLKRVASETGIPPPKLIEHAAAKGWGGIYDPRDNANDKLASIGKTRATWAMLNPGDEPF